MPSFCFHLDESGKCISFFLLYHTATAAARRSSMTTSIMKAVGIGPIKGSVWLTVWVAAGESSEFVEILFGGEENKDCD